MQLFTPVQFIKSHQAAEWAGEGDQAYPQTAAERNELMAAML